MNSFTQLRGVVAPVLGDDINTDQIIPSAYLKDVHANLGEGLFAYLRRKPNGEKNSDFVLEMDTYKHSKILLVGNNFGCGSSREHAVWALQEFGIQCLIGKSFAELFRENCLKNGVLAISLDDERYSIISNFVSKIVGAELSVDLEKCEIQNKDHKLCDFLIHQNERYMLLNGLDDIGLTLGNVDLILKWEEHMIGHHSFLQSSITTGY